MRNKCKICGTRERPVTRILRVCRECILEHWDEAKKKIDMAHKTTRREFGLPCREDLEKKAKDSSAISCSQCVNACMIPPGQRGLCNVKENREGKLHYIAGSKTLGFVDYYYDPLPTNCVAAWVCGEKKRGDYRQQMPLSPDLQEKNMAVFYQTCMFNCLYCQNWHYRLEMGDPNRMSAEELARGVDDKTRCVCYFGGDPASQMPHSIAASLAIMNKKNGNVRICWETNGSANPRLMKKAAEIALESGGTIKFDLKAFHPRIHYALTGSSNENTLENIRLLSRMMKDRPDPPLVCVSTLLVPGYINLDEVRSIARFLSKCNPEIPYSLLAFYPSFFISDLPVTSRDHALEAQEIAREEGLRRINIGNIHLLSDADYPLN